MFWVRDSSIAKRLTRMNILVSGAGLFLCCAVFVAYDVVSFREAMVHNLSIQAQIAGSDSVSALLFNDPQAAQNTLSALKAAPNIVSAGIYTPESRPFAMSGGMAPAKACRFLRFPPVKSKAHWFKDSHLLVVRQNFVQEKPAGTVFIRSIYTR